MNNWFLGTAAIQRPVDFYLWEVFFNQNAKHIKQLVELGSGYGGFSVFLLLHCYQYNIEYAGFDMREPACHWRPVSKMLGLKEKIRIGDIFEEKKPEVIKFITSDQPIMLFCDNGNKIGEFREFVPFLKAGDFIAVHDWGTEFKPKDIIYDNVEEILTDISESIGSITRFFRVTE
jgi:cephalosporin hydroxylase